jgi:hypothetical protein
MAVGLMFISFWQKSQVELITIGSWPALRGGLSTIFGVFATPQFVLVLFTVYLLYELKVPGPLKKRPFLQFFPGSTGSRAGEESECQRTAEVTDPPLTAAAWES